MWTGCVTSAATVWSSAHEEEFADSTNQGFLPLGGRQVKVRLGGRTFKADLDGANDLPKDMELLILTVLNDYRYLL